MLCHAWTLASRDGGTCRALEEPPWPARRFSSRLPLSVVHRCPGGCTWSYGETPTRGGGAIEIPPVPLWWVRPEGAPLDDAGLAAVAEVLRSESVPGVELRQGELVTDRGLEALRGIPTLRAVAVVDCPGIEGAGLGVLGSLPALEEFHLEEHRGDDRWIHGLRGLKVLHASCSEISDRGLAALGASPDLRYLYAGGDGITDGGLAGMPSLPRLEEAKFPGPGITAAGIGHLARHGSLRCLGLEGWWLEGWTLAAETIGALAALPDLRHLHGCADLESQAVHDALASLPRLEVADLGAIGSPAALRGISRVRGLEELDLDGAQLLDEDLAPVAALAGLRHLRLRNTWLTDAGLAHVEGLHAMECLDLSLTDVSDEGLGRLAGMAHLRRLSLGGCGRVTGLGLRALPATAPLEELDLERTAVDDRGLEALERFPALRRLSLDRGRTSEAGRAALRRRLPGCDISPDDGA